jgi:2,3-dihydroxybenzoate decarboxylase
MSHELKTGGDRGYLRIAAEEAFATHEQIEGFLDLIRSGRADMGTTSLWGFYAKSPSERSLAIRERLVDLDAQRLADMDATGIDIAILSLTAPGVQVFDTEFAKGMVSRANDHLAAAIERHPTRFVGMTSVAPQDPAWSAHEIKRGARELGLKGVMINSHTMGEYLDHPKFDPIFRAIVEEGQTLYIHPQSPPDSMIKPMVEAGLDGAIFGFGVEVGFHLLRLMVSGIFDRYPDLSIMVGHMGEALPFWLYRLNYMHQATVRSQRYDNVKPLKHDLFYYMRNHVYVTTSGMAWEPAILYTQQILGEDRVLYAMDYPYQYEPDEVRTHDLAAMSDTTRKKLMEDNARRIFKF